MPTYHDNKRQCDVSSPCESRDCGYADPKREAKGGRVGSVPRAGWWKLKGGVRNSSLTLTLRNSQEWG
jgi:hypothetical protein